MHVAISSRWLHECNPHPHINTTALSLMIQSLSLSSLGGGGVVNYTCQISELKKTICPPPPPPGGGVVNYPCQIYSLKNTICPPPPPPGWVLYLSDINVTGCRWSMINVTHNSLFDKGCFVHSELVIRHRAFRHTEQCNDLPEWPPNNSFLVPNFQCSKQPLLNRLYRIWAN